MTETELEQRVHKDFGGTDIEELERLATPFGLIASAQEATPQQIREVLDADSDVIAYVNRFDRESPLRNESEHPPP